MAEKQETTITINKLTPEQEKMVQDVANKWQAVQDLRTEADWGRAREAAVQLYKTVGWAEPLFFVNVGNVFSYATACCLLRTQDQLLHAAAWKTKDSEEEQEEFFDAFSSHILRLNSRTWGPMQTNALAAGIRATWDAFVVGAKEGHKPAGRIPALSTLIKNIEAIKECCTRKDLENEYYATLRGQHDVGWCAYMEIFDNLQPGCAEKALPILELTRCVGWWVPFERAVVFTDRPAGVYFSEENPNDLHRLDGPAIEYRDGFGIYCIENQLVNRHVVMDPDSITPEEIKKESNAEVKRILRQQLTDEKYLNRTNIKVIDVDSVAVDKAVPNGMSIQRALVEDDEGDRFLIGSDGSTKRVYFMPVPKATKTAKEAYERLAPGFRDEDCIIQT